jgi:hypothetical protein
LRWSVEISIVAHGKINVANDELTGTWIDRDNGWKKGSWGQPGKLQNPSNVTRIARAIKSEDDDHHPQIVYYQAGLGTGIGLYNHLAGGGLGVGLSENIREAYAFLASNYSPRDPAQDPDSIFLMGFSRGAFTARSLGGFIAAVGILTKKALPHFYECFLDWERAGDDDHEPMFINAYIQANPDQEIDARKNQPPIALAHDRSEAGIDNYMFEYRKHLLSLGLTQEAEIDAIGCWDTVGALGIPINPILQETFGLPAFLRDYRWFDTRLDIRVRHAFQALALDEHRAPYSPAVWELNSKNTTTFLKQAWFPGAHGNIGGSVDDNGTADLTLAWMMDHMSGKHLPDPSKFQSRHWIQFDDAYIDLCFKHTTNYYNTLPEPLSTVYRGWAMGKLYNTLTFPQNLAGKCFRRPGRYHRTDYVTGRIKPDQLLHNTHETVHASVRARIALGGRDIEPRVFYQKVFNRLWQLITFNKAVPKYDPQRPRALLRRAGPLAGWRLYAGDTAQPKVADLETLPMTPISPIEGKTFGEQLASATAGTKPAVAPIVWKYQGDDELHEDVRELPEDVFAPGGYEQRLLEHDRVATKVVLPPSQWRWLSKGPLRRLFARTF